MKAESDRVFVHSLFKTLCINLISGPPNFEGESELQSLEERNVLTVTTLTMYFFNSNVF